LSEWQSAGRADPDYFPAFFAAGALLVDLESAKNAQPLLEHAIALSPNDSTVQLALGKDYLDLDQPRKALPLLESATHLDPKSQPASFLLARTLKQLGRREEAAAEFKRCSALFDDGAGVLGDPIKAMQRNEP
jgi:tetratricopeptide (TPR) repeat protein